MTDELLDAGGAPIQGTHARHDILDQIVARYEAKPEMWQGAFDRFDALLSWMEPNAELLNDMLVGYGQLDATNEHGQMLVRMLCELSMTSLILNRKRQHDEAKESKRVAENGGSKA